MGAASRDESCSDSVARRTGREAEWKCGTCECYEEGKTERKG